MDHSRRMMVDFYIVISVFSLLFLGGCVHWFWDKGDHRCAARPTDAGSSGSHEENCKEYH